MQWSFIVRSKLYHGNSPKEASSPPSLSGTNIPHFPFGGKSSTVNVFGQQTSGNEEFPSHWELLKNFCCSKEIDLERMRRYNGRHCCKAMQLPFQPSGVLHGLSVKITISINLWIESLNRKLVLWSQRWKASVCEHQIKLPYGSQVAMDFCLA